MQVRVINTSFIGGEIGENMFGRIEDAGYQTGLSVCRNFVVTAQGPIESRAGFRFVHEVNNSPAKSRLIPFIYNTTQSMVLEFGNGFIRFHTLGATLLSNGVPYQLVTPYAEADIFDIHYVQSNDVLTLVHPSHPPAELRRLGAIDWSLTNISFQPTIGTPSAPTVTGSGSGTEYTYNYVVTAVSLPDLQETGMGNVGSVVNNLYVTGAKNTLTIDASIYAAGTLDHFNIYKERGGLYGYIGQAPNVSAPSLSTFIDDNVAADLSTTPPIYDPVFSSSGKYPSSVSYYEQRRVFAGTNDTPQTIWMTRSGTESNMSYSLPTRADDRIKFRVAAREANAIEHVIPLSALILLTSSSEWRITSLNSDALTPTSISVKPQSYIGASSVVPQIINTSLVYVSARGGHIREMGYSRDSNGYITGDLSLRATHLFDSLNIMDMAYSKAPLPIVWFVSSNGDLLGMTYIPEQKIGAWHRHDTQGEFETCCSVPEGDRDVLYVVVKRTIGGVTRRYIEAMANRLFTTQEDAFFVDSGMTFNGPPATTFTGLDHLEGETVNILADGAVAPQQVVQGGSVSISVAASVVHIGLPITADMSTLPVVAQTDGSFAQGRIKNINKIWFNVYRSSAIQVGPDMSSLTEIKQRTTEPYGTAPAVKSGQLESLLFAKWSDRGSVFLRQTAPLPVTIDNMVIELEIGN